MTPWHLYQTYGDKKILEDNYEAMTRYLAYLKSRESNGLVTYDGLGDWMAPSGRNVQNCRRLRSMCSDTRVMRDTAAALGKTTDAKFYAGEFDPCAGCLQQGLLRLCEHGRYFARDSSRTWRCPLEFGIVPAGRKADVAEALVNDIAQPVETTAENGQNGSVAANHITTGDHRHHVSLARAWAMPVSTTLFKL